MPHSLPPPRPKPASWPDYKQAVTTGKWTLPFHRLEWSFQWCAYYLGKGALIEVLQYSGAISVIVAVASYVWEIPDRTKQKHYQAWQVINTAQGKGGSGGRIEALQELNADGVPLVGVDAANSFLFGIKLRKGSMMRSTLTGADARQSDWEGTKFDYANLHSANFQQSNLRKVRFLDADMVDCDLTEADLTGADLTDANLDNADMRNANLSGVKWSKIESIKEANIYGVRNAPNGFVNWALEHGAVSDKDAK